VARAAVPAIASKFCVPESAGFLCHSADRDRPSQSRRTLLLFSGTGFQPVIPCQLLGIYSVILNEVEGSRERVARLAPMQVP
jgi:hypothetical protein